MKGRGWGLPGCLLLILALMLGGCGTYTGKKAVRGPTTTIIRGDRDGAPLIKLDPARIVDAVPKPEPILPWGNKSPYEVNGQTYRLLPTAAGYRERGTASWYGTKFHGRNTSNGEIYDLYAMTAAHKTLPIPCYVRVTNLDNGRTAIVRVNDRGPFYDDRIIDLSYAAAVKLGYADRGTARVHVEAITFAPGSSRYAGSSVRAGSAPPVMSTPSVAQRSEREAMPRTHYLQAGAFSQKTAATGMRSRLLQLTTQPIRIVLGRDNLHRVHIGPLAWDEVAALKQQLATNAIATTLVTH